MELKDLTFGELEEKLRKRSIGDLLKLAKGYGIVLPAGLDTKDTILRAMFDALQSSDPASSVEPGASSSPPPADAGPQIQAISTTGARYWRCGHKFTIEWQTLPRSKFTEQEIETVLKKDKHLKVRDPARV